VGKVFVCMRDREGFMYACTRIYVCIRICFCKCMGWGRGGRVRVNMRTLHMCVWGMCKIEGGKKEEVGWGKKEEVGWGKKEEVGWGKKEEVGWSEGDRGVGRAE
jgi:hypothetical protein